MPIKSRDDSLHQNIKTLDDPIVTEGHLAEIRPQPDTRHSEVDLSHFGNLPTSPSSPATESESGSRFNPPTNVAEHSQTAVSKIDFGEFYPDGGWGWVICASIAIVYIVCGGMNYGYGSVYLAISTEFENTTSLSDHSGWLGSLGVCVNMVLSPVVTTICKRKSPRLYAAIGGLIAALGILYLAFSKQVEQIYISYSIVFSIGSGFTMQAGSVVLAQYFKARRDFAELAPIVGCGVGIAIMSLSVHKLTSDLGWMAGTQTLSGIVAISIVSSLMYRSVTTFHPRRQIILHIKNQKKSRIDHELSKPKYIDFSSLRMRNVQCLIVITSIAAVGLYVPLLLLASISRRVTSENTMSVLLNVYLGLGFAIGAVCHSYIITHRNRNCYISRRNLCQGSALCCGVGLLMATMARDYNAFAIFAWIYGISFGGYVYSLKAYVYEQVKSRIMDRAWSLITAGQSVSVLIGSPIAAYINNTSSNSSLGLLFAGFFPLVGSMLFFVMGKAEKHPSNSKIIEKQESVTEYTVVETAALTNVNLSDFVSNKPLTSQLVFQSVDRKKRSEITAYQLKSIITPKDTQQPLSKISEDGESVNLDVQGASGISVGSNYLMTRTSSGRIDRDWNTETSFDHSHDLFTSSSSSSNDRSRSGQIKKGETTIRVDIVDPPSQEKESTATVSYDSDLYINMCEAMV